MTRMSSENDISRFSEVLTLYDGNAIRLGVMDFNQTMNNVSYAGSNLFLCPQGSDDH